MCVTRAGSIRNINLPNAGVAVQAIQNSHQREAFIVLPPDNAAISLHVDSDALIGTGIQLDAGSQPVVVDGSVWGNMVRKQWFAKSFSDDVTFAIIELFPMGP